MLVPRVRSSPMRQAISSAMDATDTNVATSLVPEGETVAGLIAMLASLIRLIRGPIGGGIEHCRIRPDTRGRNRGYELYAPGKIQPYETSD
jgi:hypothetical protein